MRCHLLLFYATTTNHFSIGLWCAMKSGFYTITGDDQLSGWTWKNFQSTSQSQTYTKKRSWLLFGGLPPFWSTRAFWIPVKSLHLRSMVHKSMRCTENCNASRQQWSTERAQIFSATMLTACHTTNVSEAELIGLWSFASSAIFTWPLANWLPLLQVSQKLFFRESASTPGCRKCFPRIHQILKHKFLHYRNKQTYFLLAKMCWL